MNAYLYEEVRSPQCMLAMSVPMPLKCLGLVVCRPDSDSPFTRLCWLAAQAVEVRDA